jgi:hypothetical protein
MVPVTETRKIWMAGRLSMLVIGFLALSIPAAGAGPQYMEIPAYQAPNLTAVNGSLLNSSHLLPLPPTLRPITLLHLELNETTPSGVRYMAFGPKVIDISVSPILLVILAGFAVAAVGAWLMLGRRGKMD